MGELSWCDVPAVLARRKVSRATLYREINAGDFPAPQKRGRRSVWLSSVVDQAIAEEAERLPSWEQSRERPAPSKEKPLKSAA